jgi:broad specificity phosphatase PhoE
MLLLPQTSFCVVVKFFLSVFMFRTAFVMSQKMSSKRLYIVRHGQAMHNPRAEVAKANGCTMEEFFELMRQDDVLDAPLTEIGKEQAKSAAIDTNISSSITKAIELVVASSLSRAIQTADLVYPTSCPRISLEQFREVHGDLLCAKRRTRQELQTDFAAWNFEQLDGDDDAVWTPEMEAYEAAAERGYQGLRCLMNRPEESILLVSHGGILRYMMTIHPLIQLKDGRTKRMSGDELKAVESRFENCEVRSYEIQWSDDEESCQDDGNNGSRRSIVLTQVDD